MKYAKQFNTMVTELRNNGLEVKSNANQAFTVKGYYVETSSVTDIYKGRELVKSFKTPKSAIKFLLNN